MRGKIFVSYRRNDEPRTTARISDRLEDAFGSNAVFTDTKHTTSESFVDVIFDALRRADVVLLIIGPQWLTASSDRGRRLDAPSDFIRLEISTALQAGKIVIPVLVGGAEMPRTTDLPDALKPLVDRNAIRIRPEAFDADVARLIETLRAILAKAADRRDTATESAQPSAAPSETAPPLPTPPPSARPQRAVRLTIDLRALLAKARSAAVATLRWLRRALTWLAVGATVTAAATYGLALVALETLDPPLLRPAMTLPVRTADVAMAPTIGGHAAPIRHAALIGGHAVTVDADGTVRATRADGHDWRSLLDLSQPLALLARTVWQPYGRPVADLALSATAQVFPLHIPEAAQGRRGRAFRDCKDNVCGPEMVEITPGAFLMGAPWTEAGSDYRERPRRLVTIAQPFAVSKFEVTFDDWAACVNGGGCQGNKTPADQGWGRGRRPVIKVSWNDAQAYVTWLSQKTGQTYRLLSEAEWEYAARAGTTTPFSFGATISTDQANYNGNFTYGSGVKGVYRQKTIEVGSLNAPNAWGLHDMHGNVWEWVQDCFVATYKDAPSDGTQAVKDPTYTYRVLRGGSWFSIPQGLRSASRYWNAPDFRVYFQGFRLARSLVR